MDTKLHSVANANIILSVLLSHNPKPTIELDYQTDFELLIAAILSARTKDKQVNRTTAELFKFANTPEAIKNMDKEVLISYLQHVGMFRVKTDFIIKTSNILFERHNSQVPRTREELEALPGVGRKVANVVLNTLYKQPVIAVDTHVFRVAKRCGISTGNTPKQVELDLYSKLEPRFYVEASHALVLHGRYICKPKPLCHLCPIRQYCLYYQKAGKDPHSI